MPPFFAWQALHGQGWPSSENQEKAFVEDLRRTAESLSISKEDLILPKAPSRTAVTVLMNALRCGVTYEQLIEALPAAKPEELLAAYEFLSLQLTAANTAWQALIASPSLPAWSTHHAAAQLLLPVPVHRIEVALNSLVTPVRVQDSVTKIATEVHRITSGANHIEERILDVPHIPKTAIRLGRSLHDGSEPGVWTHPYFAAKRVGQLSTTRVRDMFAVSKKNEKDS